MIMVMVMMMMMMTMMMMMMLKCPGFFSISLSKLVDSNILAG